MQLHLGCGQVRLPGWINCDLTPAPGVDRVFDLERRWPFPDGSVTRCVAAHVLEHLGNPMAFFREAWRVLQPDGGLHLRLPYGGHRAAWWDLTHVRPWFAENFAIFQPGYAEAIGNPQHDARGPWFAVATQVRLGRVLRPLVRARWRRRLVAPYLDLLATGCEELLVDAAALKTPDAVAAYRAMHEPTVVACTWVMYRHDLEGRHLRPQEAGELVPIFDGGRSAA